MMLAVVRNPTDDVAFDGALTKYRERVAHPAIGLKRPVREKSVIADRDPYARQDIADEQNHQLAGHNHSVPQQRDRYYQTHEGQHRPSQIGQLAGARHARANPMAGPGFGRGLDDHRAHATGIASRRRDVTATPGAASQGCTAVVAVAELFAGFGSASCALTVAVLTMLPFAVGLTVMLTVAFPPFGMVPRLQVT